MDDDDAIKTDNHIICMGCGLTFLAEPRYMGPFLMAPPDKCEECLKHDWFAKKHLVLSLYKPAGWRPKK